MEVALTTLATVFIINFDRELCLRPWSSNLT